MTEKAHNFVNKICVDGQFCKVTVHKYFTQQATTEIDTEGNDEI